MMVEAQLEGLCGTAGAVVVEPSPDFARSSVLQLEEMVLNPDAEGRVLLMVMNNSGESQTMEADQLMGLGCPWEEPSGSTEEVQGCVDVVVPDAELVAVQAIGHGAKVVAEGLDRRRF